jgi:hypothetical protein
MHGPDFHIEHVKAFAGEQQGLGKLWRKENDTKRKK